VPSSCITQGINDCISQRLFEFLTIRSPNHHIQKGKILSSTTDISLCSLSIKMHIFTFASAVLLCIHPTPISAWTCGSCIADYEVGGIASRWLNAFATGGLPGLDKAVTQDVLILSLEVSSQHQSLRRLKALRSNSINQIHIYDEGAQNGSTIPYIQNYHQLVESISASAYGGGGVTNVTYDVVFTFHTCDRIALRWQENAYTTANVGYGR